MEAVTIKTTAKEPRLGAHKNLDTRTILSLDVYSLDYASTTSIYVRLTTLERVREEMGACEPTLRNESDTPRTGSVQYNLVSYPLVPTGYRFGVDGPTYNQIRKVKVTA